MAIMCLVPASIRYDPIAFHWIRLVVPFADRLALAVQRCRNPVVVGLDPRLDQLPPPLQDGISSGQVDRIADAYARFCQLVIDVVAPLVPAVKPQLAFFEELGPPGLAALHQTIQHARRSGLLVLLDGKRNDIGSTAIAYARAYLGPESPWQGDALTISPYLGPDTIEPFVHAAVRQGAGLFVLVKTSNPGSAYFQDLSCQGRTVYQHVAARVEQFAADTAGDAGYGVAGAVVGATYPEQLAELRRDMPHAWLLVPGYGAQGGAARDVAAGFDERGLGAIINSSRGIIFAHARPPYRDRYAGADWQRAVEDATRDMIAELAAETAAGRL